MFTRVLAPRVRRLQVLGLCVAGLLLAGCGATDQEVVSAAQAFVGAAPAQACGLLAPRTFESLERRAGSACPEALTKLALPHDTAVTGVEVAGERAQVRFSDEVLFLARFPEGWRVTDAGCTRSDPDQSVPYECEVEP